jgi:serine protease
MRTRNLFLTTTLSVLALGAVAASSPSDARASTPHRAIAEAVEEIPGEIAIDLRDDLDDAAVASFARDFGLADLLPNGKGSATDRVERAHVAEADEGALLARLRSDPRVEAAEPMYVVRASFVPDDPLYRDQWHMPRVGAEKAWEYACGQGVTVAVIDTGVACYDDAPFKKGSDLLGTRCTGGWNFVDDRKEAWDDQGHGSHVAGTIAQTTNNGAGVSGLAHCARLMPVKVLNEFGWGTSADVAQGIRWAADHGAQVINLSLGSSAKSAVIESAVKHALARKVTVVAAAGNSGGKVGFPAGYDGVIAVSATNQTDGLAWFSSRGPEIAIAAPGVAVTQQTVCNHGRDACEIFTALSGTSMASPHVAGAAAMLVSQGVTDPEAVRSALQSTADPKDDATKFGAGILNVGAAAAKVHWRHVAVRAVLAIGLLMLLARRVRRKGGEPARGFGTWLGLLVAGVGLAFFAPLLGLAAKAGRLRILVELASRPLGEWDLVASAQVHRWLPLANAIPVIALTTLLFGVRRLRPLLAGLAIGMTAFTTQLAIAGEVATPFPMLATRLWLVLNAGICAWIALIALDRKPN